MSVVVVMSSKGELFEIVPALRSSGRFTSLLNGRKQQCHQNSDDRNHNEKLNQSKASNCLFRHGHEWTPDPVVRSSVFHQRQTTGINKVLRKWLRDPELKLSTKKENAERQLKIAPFPVVCGHRVGLPIRLCIVSGLGNGRRRQDAAHEAQHCSGRRFTQNCCDWTFVDNASGLPCCGRAVHGLVGPVKVPHGPRTRITGGIVLRQQRGEIRECRRRNRSSTASSDRGLSSNAQTPLKVQRSVQYVPASACGSTGTRPLFDRRQATGGALHGTGCTDFTASVWQRGGKRFSSHTSNNGADWISVSSRGADTA